jgi:hypothetical protein
MRKYQARFWRAAALVRESLTLIVNAAQNILAAGLAVKVCGANVRPHRHKSDGSCYEAERSKK